MEPVAHIAGIVEKFSAVSIPTRFRCEFIENSLRIVGTLAAVDHSW
jgi:hypothetical protein